MRGVEMADKVVVKAVMSERIEEMLDIIRAQIGIDAEMYSHSTVETDGRGGIRRKSVLRSLYEDDSLGYEMYCTRDIEDMDAGDITLCAVKNEGEFADLVAECFGCNLINDDSERTSRKNKLLRVDERYNHLMAHIAIGDKVSDELLERFRSEMIE